MASTSRILIKPYEYFPTPSFFGNGKENAVICVAKAALKRIANLFYWIANGGITAINFVAKFFWTTQKVPAIPGDVLKGKGPRGAFHSPAQRPAAGPLEPPKLMLPPIPQSPEPTRRPPTPPSARS